MPQNRHAEDAIAIRSLGLRMPPHYRIETHAHEGHQLVYATEGVMTVDTPLGGIPVDVNVPVDVVVPIDIVVDIPIDETVPISDEFPVQLDVPIVIEVGDTELANLTESLAAGLESLREVLSGLS